MTITDDTRAAAIASLDPLLSMKEVSGYLGVPVKTLRNWRVLGKGPASIRPGREVRYRLSAVKRYVDSLSGDTSGT